MYVPELSERHLEVEKKYFFHLLIVTEKEKSSFPMAFASLPSTFSERFPISVILFDTSKLGKY